MSFSTCLKCGNRVGWYEKYCSLCQGQFGLPNLPDWQKTNFTRGDFAEWAKKEVEKDMAKIKKAGKQAHKTKQEELLSILETAFTQLLKDINWKETRATYEQAEAEIVALIKKEVTEEWIEEKAIELNNEILLESHSGSYIKMCKGFIRKIIKEVLNGPMDK